MDVLVYIYSKIFSNIVTTSFFFFFQSSSCIACIPGKQVAIKKYAAYLFYFCNMGVLFLGCVEFL